MRMEIPGTAFFHAPRRAGIEFQGQQSLPRLCYILGWIEKALVHRDSP